MALGSRRACADTLEPWPDCHKPLVAYLLIGFVNLLLGLFLELHGFELQRVGRLAYWARPARESMLRPPPPPPMPLVVLHGVLGLLPYALMLRQLSRDHDGAVLAPLFPHCAVQLEHLCSALPPPLDATELVATIRSMVARYTHVESAVQASFVAHSLGTGYLALLCRRAPELPAAVAFIDPICFLLPDGHVLRNYLYQPVTLGLSTWFHWLQRYLVADEPTQQDYFRNIFWWASSWIHPSELRASAHHGALSSPPQVGVLMASPVRAAVRCARSALGTRLSRVCAQRVHTPQGLARLAWTDHWTVRCKRSPWRSNGPWRSPWRGRHLLLCRLRLCCLLCAGDNGERGRWQHWRRQRCSRRQLPGPGAAVDGGRDSQRADGAGWVRVGGRRSGRWYRSCLQLSPMRISYVKRLAYAYLSIKQAN